MTRYEALKRATLRRVLDRALAERAAGGDIGDAELAAITLGTARVIDAEGLRPLDQGDVGKAEP